MARNMVTGDAVGALSDKQRDLILGISALPDDLQALMIALIDVIGWLSVKDRDVIASFVGVLTDGARKMADRET